RGVGARDRAHGGRRIRGRGADRWGALRARGARPVGGDRGARPGGAARAPYGGGLRRGQYCAAARLPARHPAAGAGRRLPGLGDRGDRNRRPCGACGGGRRARRSRPPPAAWRGEGRHVARARRRAGGRPLARARAAGRMMELRRVGEVVWEIPRQGGMRVPARVYASEAQMATLRDDPALAQLVNVAHLPGIVGHALAMPDVHWGYGFPIGGVAAVDADEGVVTPGGIGFDINCGVRLLATRLAADDIADARDRLADPPVATVPACAGSTGAVPARAPRDTRRVLERGAAWAVEEGFGRASDLEHCEEEGRLRGADPDAVSETARTRGRTQMGTLGSGNHFLEVQRVERVHDTAAAAALGLEEGQAGG